VESDVETKVVRTICRECKTECGMLVHVQGGRAIKVEGAPDPSRTMEKFCSRAEASLERLYHAARLHYPQKRVGERGEGKWQRITWDEALDTIAQKFATAKDKHGAESVVLAKPTSFHGWEMSLGHPMSPVLIIPATFPVPLAG